MAITVKYVGTKAKSPGPEPSAPPTALAPAPPTIPDPAPNAARPSAPGPTAPVATPVISAEGVAPVIAERPTQQGPRGIVYDFNDGCRVVLPESEHPWRVRLSDLDTGNILFETELKAGRVNSTKRYYVRFRLEVWQQGESVFVHEYAAAGRDVLVRFPVDTLGDPLGWFPYAVKFKELHGCRLTCTMSSKMISLLRDSYPDVTFMTEPEVVAERFYASYTIAVFYQANLMYDHKDCVPCDFRRVGLHRAAGYILGVDPTEQPPHLVLPDDSRPIVEPYVCIATQSTLQSKYWNNPTGWSEIVNFLKGHGYRVVCIDLKSTHGKGLVWNHMPPGAEDQTGDKPLLERARWLKHAEFFIGLSSGLSWLAWAMRTPVVMISGLTHPINEFATPYRVINYHACNSCWNDPLAPFDRSDYLSCPRHKDTPRQFECTRLITADQVKQTIMRIPGFGSNRRTIVEVANVVDRPPYRGLFINLDRSGERGARMQEQLKRLNLEQRYSRFSAVDARLLPSIPGKLTAGEYGCFKSHILALESVRDNRGTIHVVEDDVDFVPQLEQIISSFDARGLLDPFDLVFTDAGVNWDVLRLRRYKQLFDEALRSDPPGVNLLDFNDAYLWGTESYMVPRRALEKVLSVLHRGMDAGPNLPVDLYMREEARAGRLRLGLLFPFITGAQMSEVGLTTIAARGKEGDASREVVALLRHSFFLGRDLKNLPPTVLEKLRADDDDEHSRLIQSVLGFVVASREFSPF